MAKAYAKDAVIFIFGVLAISAAITKTGLDRRLGMLLLGTSTSLRRLIFIFCPLLAVSASFLSEHALVAFLVPVLLLVYGGAVRAAGLRQGQGPGRDDAPDGLLLGEHRGARARRRRAGGTQ